MNALARIKYQSERFNPISGKNELFDVLDYVENAFEYAFYLPKGLKVPKEVEEMIADSSDHAYWYARDVLRGRFALGEAAIARDTYNSCWYAIEVLKRRFELGEPAIARDPQSSYLYAKAVLKGKRVKIIEESILQRVDLALAYAIHVLKGRFVEAEWRFSQNKNIALSYALEALKGRFPAGEEIISTSPRHCDRYVKDVLALKKKRKG